MPKLKRPDPHRIWLVLWNGQPAGYPTPFEFATRKEAMQKMQRLAHQVRDGETSVVTKAEWEKAQRGVR